MCLKVLIEKIVKYHYVEIVENIWKKVSLKNELSFGVHVIENNTLEKIFKYLFEYLFFWVK